MANNRIFLRCKKCGSIFPLGKTIGNGYYNHVQSQIFKDGLNNFYQEHNFCDRPKNDVEIKYIDTPFKDEEPSNDNIFEIAYESEY